MLYGTGRSGYAQAAPLPGGARQRNRSPVTVPSLPRHADGRAPAPAEDAFGAGLVPPFWARPGGVALIVGLYLAAHAAVRGLLGPVLGLDDAEQMLFAQAWAWSYRFEQPPLFTWLLTALTQVAPPGALAATILRYALLAVLYAAVFRVARATLSDPRLAALTVYAYATIYVFGYYSHHDLTHTTMMATLLAVAWWVFARLARSPHAGNYVLLGLVFGLGVLGKWNFLMFAAALPLALLALPRWRPLVWTPRTLAAIGVMAATVLPSAVWVATRVPDAGAVAGGALAQDGGADGFGATVVAGTAELAEALIAYPQPFLPLALICFAPALWRGLTAGHREVRLSPEPIPDRPDAGLLWTVIGIGIGLHWLVVPLLGATTFEERWLQPIFMMLPLAVFAIVERGRPARWSFRAFLAATAVLVLVALVWRPIDHWRGADHCGSCRPMVPFPALAEQLRAAGFAQGTVIAGDFHIGGNLRVFLTQDRPGSRLVYPGIPPTVFPNPPPAAAGGQCLLAWRVSDGRPDVQGPTDPPADLIAMLTGPLGGDADAPHDQGVAEAPMAGSETRTYQLGWRLYPQPNGACR